MSVEDNDPKTERINALIDSNLKLIFADLVQEELPDNLKNLLVVLHAQDDSKGSDRGNPE